MASHSTHTSRAAVFTGSGQPLEIQDFVVREPGAGEAVVRIECCTLCGSDLHTISGKRTEPTPTILGHEILGFVEAVGTPPLHDYSGSPLAPGDRVTWSVAVSCGECDRCQAGFPQKCRSLIKYGHALATGSEALSGGLAEKIVLRPGTTAIKLPQEISSDAMCPVNCATATVAAAYRLAGKIADRHVLIFGAGMLGLTAAAWACANSAKSVTVCDVSSERLQRARAFGVDQRIEWNDDWDAFETQIRESRQGEGFDIILELSGAPVAVSAGLKLANLGARIVLVGSVMPAGEVGFDPEQIVRRWISIHGVHNYTPHDLEHAVRFLENHHQSFPFAELVEATFELADINHAIEYALNHHPIRIAVRPQQGINS